MTGIEYLLKNYHRFFISIHATDPKTREQLLKNKKASQILEQIKWLEQNSIQIHAQIVVCPEINDGKILEKSINDLAKFHKKVLKRYFQQP